MRRILLSSAVLFLANPALVSESWGQTAIVPNISWQRISAGEGRGPDIAHFVDEGTPSFGVRVTRLLGGIGKGEASYSYSRTSVTTRLLSLEEEIGNQAFSSSTMSLHFLRLGLVRDLITNELGRSFYYSLGGGVAFMNPSRGRLSFDPSGFEDDPAIFEELSAIVDPLVSLAAGVRWPMGHRAALRFELQDDLQFCNAEDVDVGHYVCPVSEVKQHLNFTVGVEIPM